MERLGLCFMVGLLCVWGASAQNHSNMTFVPYPSNTSFPYSSGSGIGSGSADCSSAGCSHNCSDTSTGPVCMCPVGMQLRSDMMTCEACQGKRWGPECANFCPCGVGNRCDPVAGTCLCNLCWTGPNCDTPLGYQCFLRFLQNPQKRVEILQLEYGGDAIPVPPSSEITSLVANDLMEVSVNVLQNVNLEIVNRTQVNQGPVAKLTWRVDYNTVGRTAAERGLTTLENKVKVGDVRATLVIQTLTDAAEVTLNAGTSY